MPPSWLSLWTKASRTHPTTSIDSYYADRLRWFGVPEGDLPSILPNIENFSTEPDLGLFAPGAGESTLTATVPSSDRGIFTINIGPDLSLKSLFLLNYDRQPRTPANPSYPLSQPDPNLAAPPSNADPYPGGDIRYVGIGEWAEGRNIPRFLAVGPPYGNAETVREGTYAFWTNGDIGGFGLQFPLQGGSDS